MFFKNCIEEFTAPKAKAVDSTVEEVETVTQLPRELPFFGASIDRATPVPQNLSFPGMIVTSIDYDERPQTGRPKRITFSGSTPGGSGDGARIKAIFVKNVKNIGGDTYEGDQMSADEALAYFTEKHAGATPLFFIHGYNNEPQDTLHAVNKAQAKMGVNHVIIPIIWPCHNSLAGELYHLDRGDNAPEAAEELALAFGATLQTTSKFAKKNLLCHSMGNYILRKAAGKIQNLKFDNIFLVAADLRHNLFDEDFINRSSNPANKEGLHILRLLKQKNGQPVGKIYVVHNWEDYALGFSTGIGGNWVNRMGQAGVGTYDKWFGGWGDNVNLLHPEIRHHTENFNAGARLNGVSDYKSHSYQWMDFMINYYKSKLG